MRAAALVVLALALLAGCGGSSGSEGSSASTAETSPTTDSGAPTAAASELPQPSWPAPPNPLELTKQAGLEPERRETLAYHVHAHLDVYVDGERVLVPAGVGIDTTDPGVLSGDAYGGPAYGGIDLCAKPCISPLHTHDVTGVLHTESLTARPNRLGQFFVEWGVRLDESCVGEYCKPDVPIDVYVNGERYEGNPADIPLADLTEIAVVIGTPPPVIPDTFDPSQVA
jgi:hypothetical protein